MTCLTSSVYEFVQAVLGRVGGQVYKQQPLAPSALTFAHPPTKRRFTPSAEPPPPVDPCRTERRLSSACTDGSKLAEFPSLLPCHGKHDLSDNDTYVCGGLLIQGVPPPTAQTRFANSG